MKVINHTTWNTADLKAILQVAAEKELEPAKRRKMVVTVEYTRGGYSSGCAFIGGRHATVRIQKANSRAWQNMTSQYVPLEPGDSTTSGSGTYENGVRINKLAREFPKGLTDKRLTEIKLHFASVASHEFAHLRGMNHDIMPANYKWHGRWRDYVAWAADFALAVNEPKRKTVTPDNKLAHVLVKVRQAETRVKRAETILRKWKTKQRYYQRKMAAQGGDHGT